MLKRDIKRNLIKEIEFETPDVLDSILLNCAERENVMENKEKNKKKNIFLPLSMALAVFLLMVSFVGYQGYNTLYKTNAVIEFDVNPSIELKINGREKITEARALNEDGKKILKGMDLENSDLNVGVNAIIGSMLKEGYISDIKNSILVSVNSENKVEAGKLQKQLSNEIDKILKTYSISSSVVTQKYDDSNEQLNKQATESGISKGKAEYINRILEENLTNKAGEKYTFDILSKLSINELNVILNAKNKTVKNTTSTGAASTKGYIGRSKAKQIALSNAGVSEKNTRDLEVELDYERGKMMYEVSFNAGSGEYEYEIDAVTGFIIHKDVEADDDYRGSVSSSSSNSSNSTSSTRKSSSSSSSKSYIGNSRATQIALSNAGASSSGVRELETDFDYDNGRAIYEVSFKFGNKEYDYDIDATSGSIIKRNIEIDD